MRKIIVFLSVLVVLLTAFSVLAQEEDHNEAIPSCGEDDFEVLAAVVPNYVEKLADIFERSEEIPAEEWWDWSDRVDVLMGETYTLHVLWWNDVEDFPRCAYAVELAYVGERLFSELELAMFRATAGLGVWYLGADLFNVIEDLTDQYLTLVETMGEN
jgi:hypothetical protein